MKLKNDDFQLFESMDVPEIINNFNGIKIMES
jgi:hypothetical protein